MVRKTVSGVAKTGRRGSANELGAALPTSRKGSATAKASTPKPAQASKAGVRSQPVRPVAAAQQAASRGMLRAGLKALSDVRDDVVARQGRMFESLLGLGQPGVAKAVAALPDPFGFRKFEDVFDERVGRALERLGMPSAAAIQALSDRVDALAQTVERLAGTKAPQATPSSGRNAGQKRRTSTSNSKTARGSRQDP